MFGFMLQGKVYASIVKLGEKKRGMGRRNGMEVGPVLLGERWPPHPAPQTHKEFQVSFLPEN